jgi:hypothetical protein
MEKTRRKIAGHYTKALLFFLIILSLGFTPEERTIKILAVGDSITQGGKRERQEYTYRLPLQLILYNAKISFDFIGSRQTGLHPDAIWPDVAEGKPFDPDHEGYYGKKTKLVCDTVTAALKNNHQVPDIVLVHLGTNDQKFADFEKNVGQPLRKFIQFLREINPNVIVLLGHLNFNDSAAAFEIRKVVEQVAFDLNTEKSPVRTVHHYINWNEKPDELYSDTYDWAHPNLKGQEKMAINWYEAMKPFMSKIENE